MTGSTTIYTQLPLKTPGWCEANGIEHSWETGPTLTSNPPIATRRCVNCGKVQHHSPGQWRDRSQ